jgi:antitoxin (DNA-binding transcriptional repressor) of toxin-antitoxin stability system
MGGLPHERPQPRLVEYEGGPAIPATITVEEAQSKLKELIDKLVPGEEIIITENQHPVAKLVGERPARLALVRGWVKGPFSTWLLTSTTRSKNSRSRIGELRFGADHVERTAFRAIGQHRRQF